MKLDHGVLAVCHGTLQFACSQQRAVRSLTVASLPLVATLHVVRTTEGATLGNTRVQWGESALPGSLLPIRAEPGGADARDLCAEVYGSPN